jgi:hypothetical protein
MGNADILWGELNPAYPAGDLSVLTGVGEIILYKRGIMLYKIGDASLPFSAENQISCTNRDKVKPGEEL